MSGSRLSLHVNWHWDSSRGFSPYTPPGGRVYPPKMGKRFTPRRFRSANNLLISSAINYDAHLSCSCGFACRAAFHQAENRKPYEVPYPPSPSLKWSIQHTCVRHKWGCVSFNWRSLVLIKLILERFEQGAKLSKRLID